jgi:hypothetical protein
MEQAAEFKDKQAVWEKKCTGLEERLRKAEERERMLRDLDDDGFGTARFLILFCFVVLFGRLIVR